MIDVGYDQSKRSIPPPLPLLEYFFYDFFFWAVEGTMEEGCGIFRIIEKLNKKAKRKKKGYHW
jgi:hypothetical protein